MIDYVLDTNVAIFVLQGLLAKPLDDRLVYAISAMTRIELLGAPGLSAIAESKRKAFVAALSNLPIDGPVIDSAIGFRRDRRLKAPDAIIAATAHEYRAILLTNDADLLRALGPMAQPVPLAAIP